jgi:tripartite-type tricarboxylate transporter receptor subunit TctC
MRCMMMAGALAAVFTSTAAAQNAETYYAGRRLTFLINFAPGGPTDIEGRLFARHVAKHIPGKPTFIVQNMDGAGGGAGVNYLGEVAPRDGTMVGYLSGSAWRYVTTKDTARTDFLSYRFVAYQPGTTVYFVRADVSPGLKTPADIIKGANLVIGGLSADSSKDLLLRLTADMLGLKYKYVTGYKSNSAARLAFQRGEINLFAESPPGYRSTVAPSLIASGEALPLFYNPGWNGTRMAQPAQVKDLDMPSFVEFYRKVKGEEPSGRLWDVYRQVLAVSGAMQRLVAFPPDAPEAAVRAFQQAVRKLETDREFAEEAAKLLEFVPDYEAGDTVQADVRRALTVPAADREWLAEYVRRSNR